jgi:hypothetical protein
MAQWAASGAIVPLDDYIAKSSVKRDVFFPGSVLNKDGSRAAINSPEAVAALKYLKQLEADAPLRIRAGIIARRRAASACTC